MVEMTNSKMIKLMSKRKKGYHTFAQLKCHPFLVTKKKGHHGFIVKNKDIVAINWHKTRPQVKNRVKI